MRKMKGCPSLKHAILLACFVSSCRYWRPVKSFTVVPAKVLSLSSLLMSVNSELTDDLDDSMHSQSTDDSMFLWLRQNLPVQVQYFMRDFGLVRAIMDGSIALGIPYIIQQYPSALSDFLRLSGCYQLAAFLESFEIIDPGQDCEPVTFERISYGNSSENFVDVMTPKMKPSNDLPLVIFVHGGAFGSGFPAMYRLMAIPFLSSTYNVAIVGYRTYPNGLATDQMEDVRSAIGLLQRKFPGAKDITLIGHSTGAYLLTTSALLGKLEDFDHISRIIALAGLYDIPSHYQFEKERGVERVSPLSVACGGTYQRWKSLSPLRMLSTPRRVEDDTRTPRMLAFHGNNDTTVPPGSSIQFAEAWNATVSKDCELILLDGSGHADCIVDLMFGGPTREIVMNWMNQ